MIRQEKGNPFPENLEASDRGVHSGKARRDLASGMGIGLKGAAAVLASEAKIVSVNPEGVVLKENRIDSKKERATGLEKERTTGLEKEKVVVSGRQKVIVLEKRSLTVPEEKVALKARKANGLLLNRGWNANVSHPGRRGNVMLRRLMTD